MTSGRHHEVVVIGGGITGASVAYHAAAMGVRSVLVLDAGQLGGGSTSRGNGGIRQQFSSEVNVRLSQRSRAKLLAFPVELGADPHFTQGGYLFLVTRERDVAPFEAGLALQHRLGVPSRRIEVDEIERLVPFIRTDDVIFGAHCPDDGWVEPWAVFDAYVQGARRLGVEFREDARVTHISTRGGRIEGVVAGAESIGCDVLVNAAGAWAGAVGALAGIEVPVTPSRRHAFETDAVPGLPPLFPFTFEFESSLSIRAQAGGVTLSMSDRSSPSGFDDSVDWGFLPTIVERAMSRMPILEGSGIRTGRAGLYEDTPDRHAIVGRHPELPNFVCAAGSSGHGLMHGPAIGEVTAQIILDRPTSVDVAGLRPGRFADGELVREQTVIE